MVELTQANNNNNSHNRKEFKTPIVGDVEGVEEVVVGEARAQVRTLLTEVMEILKLLFLELFRTVPTAYVMPRFRDLMM